MDLHQINFLAENELIWVKPKFNEAALMLISGQFGPFEAGIPIQVPLWVALHLKRRQKCVVISPEWLTPVELKRMLAAESDNEKFTQIPERFFEFSHVLLTQCKDDVDSLDETRTLVKDIWDKRSSKLKTSVIGFFASSPTCFTKVDNITQFEVSHVRRFMTSTASTVHKLSDIVLELDSQHFA